MLLENVLTSKLLNRCSESEMLQKSMMESLKKCKYCKVKRRLHCSDAVFNLKKFFWLLFSDVTDRVAN